MICEGGARIQHQNSSLNSLGQQEVSEVFYNPVQVFNRDLSVLVSKFYINQLKDKGIEAD
jgi:tRNA G26 N,N-dimethylase Trm1